MTDCSQLPKEKAERWTRWRAFAQIRHSSNIQLLPYSLVTDGPVARFPIGVPCPVIRCRSGVTCLPHQTSAAEARFVQHVDKGQKVARANTGAVLPPPSRRPQASTAAAPDSPRSPPHKPPQDADRPTARPP
jgi:hypothetical protein